MSDAIAVASMAVSAKTERRYVRARPGCRAGRRVKNVTDDAAICVQ